jgi:hypothetical protein
MCDRRPRPSPAAGTTARAVVSDDPSRAITLTAYGADGSAVAIPLTPQRALDVAAQLIDAARRRLG